MVRLNLVESATPSTKTVLKLFVYQSGLSVWISGRIFPNPSITFLDCSVSQSGWICLNQCQIAPVVPYFFSSQLSKNLSPCRNTTSSQQAPYAAPRDALHCWSRMCLCPGLILVGQINIVLMKLLCMWCKYTKQHMKQSLLKYVLGAPKWLACGCKNVAGKLGQKFFFRFCLFHVTTTSNSHYGVGYKYFLKTWWWITWTLWREVCWLLFWSHHSRL